VSHLPFIAIEGLARAAWWHKGEPHESFMATTLHSVAHGTRICRMRTDRQGPAIGKPFSRDGYKDRFLLVT
jgi:hypothetical protein